VDVAEREAVLSSQQQSVVMEQCDQSRMNLHWQTKELLLGKMKSFSNKRLLKTVLEDLEILEDLSMVWRSLSFSEHCRQLCRQMLSPEAANIAEGLEVRFTFVFGNHFSGEKT
jgi:hypothetical protein